MNHLELKFRQIAIAKRDRRYRCLVSLIRADRPRYWTFLCHNCGSRVVELMNYEIVMIDDFYDSQNVSNHGVGKHCKGLLSDGTACPYTYFFVLN